MQRFGRTGTLVAAIGALAVAMVAAGVVDWRSDNNSAPTPERGASTASQAPYDGSNPFRTGRTLVIPHGGGDGLFPEDTLLAFQRTIAMGADVVDVDLRLSKDDVVVVFHDATTDRITGTTGSVREMTFDQLRKLDAGWSFTTADSNSSAGDSHPFRGKNVTIPTLQSILDEFPTTLVSIDLKDESLDIVEPVCELLQAHHRSNDVFVGSNSDEQILDFRRVCPGVRTSAIMGDVYAALDARASNDANFVPAVTVDQPPFRSGSRQLVDAASLGWAHQHGIAILTWVVNDVADMKLLVGLGVDGIYTSYPDRLLKLLGRCTAKC